MVHNSFPTVTIKLRFLHSNRSVALHSEITLHLFGIKSLLWNQRAHSHFTVFVKCQNRFWFSWDLARSAAMADVKKSLQLLFDRPNESLITPKGDNKAVFQLTEQFLVS